MFWHHLNRVIVPICEVLAVKVNKSIESKKALPTGFTLHYIKKTPGSHNWKPIHVVFITQSNDTALQWISKIQHLMQYHGKYWSCHTYLTHM